MRSHFCSIDARIHSIERQAVIQAMTYQVDDWRRQDWQKGSRHYCCELKQNLFGQWVVSRRWGRVTALQGQSLEHPCDSYEQGLEIMSVVEKRRTKRGYVAR